MGGWFGRLDSVAMSNPESGVLSMHAFPSMTDRIKTMTYHNGILIMKMMFSNLLWRSFNSWFSANGSIVKLSTTARR